MTPRVVLILGTRPEVTKLAPVYRALSPLADVIVVAVYQHAHLLPMFMTEFGLPNYHSVVVDRRADPDASLAELTAAAVRGIDDRLASLKPDLVLVQGDTTTALCGALAAFYRGIPVGHVEAGLRTSSTREPFPEELNRRLITRIAALHFAPTDRAVINLVRDNIDEETVRMVGNTTVDSLVDALRGEGTLTPGRFVLRLKPEQPRNILVTCHRREDLARRLPLLVEALRYIAERTVGVDITWPLHPNPTIVGLARERLSGFKAIDLRTDVSYREFVALLSVANLVITDSGGVIEEATTLGRPLLIIREETERPEAIHVGGAELVQLRHMDPPEAFAALIMRHVREGTPRTNATDVFGDGHAGERIAAAVVDFCRARTP